MEIQKNEYIRTKKYICKVTKIMQQDEELPLYYCTDLDFGFLEKDIVKHSFNIIDLIEVGDYVNGCLVVKHSYKPELYVSYVYVGGKIQTTIEDYTSKLEDIEIKSIVTKEQFESIKYEV